MKINGITDSGIFFLNIIILQYICRGIRDVMEFPCQFLVRFWMLKLNRRIGCQSSCSRSRGPEQTFHSVQCSDLWRWGRTWFGRRRRDSPTGSSRCSRCRWWCRQTCRSARCWPAAVRPSQCSEMKQLCRNVIVFQSRIAAVGYTATYLSLYLAKDGRRGCGAHDFVGDGKGQVLRCRLLRTQSVGDDGQARALLKRRHLTVI